MRVRMRAVPPPTVEEEAAIAERERIERLEDLEERLRHRRTHTRAGAARELAAEGPAATAMLCAALHDEEPVVREAAAKSLGTIGDPEAVLSLCTALRHRSLGTKEAAATALGAIGDSRALPHLLRTQRERFGGRSARLQLVTTPLLLAAGAAVVIAHFFGNLSWRGSVVTVLLYLAVQHPLRVFTERAFESAFCGAVIEAIRRIAERNPQPELHKLVPELRAVADNRLQHNKATRDSARATAERLEALTAQIQQLPLPADPAEDASENLPLPV